MPIIEIDIIMLPDETLPRELARVMADALGEIFESGERKLWLRINPLSAQYYAENAGDEVSEYPLFVKVLQARWPNRETMAKYSEEVAEAVSHILSTPKSRIHIIWEAQAEGRIAFAGKLVDPWNEVE